MFKDTKITKLICILVLLINVVQLTGLLFPNLRKELTDGSTAMMIAIIIGCTAGITAAILSLMQKASGVAFVLGALYMLAIIYNQYTLLLSHGITVWGVICILAPVVFSDVLNSARDKKKRRL